MQQAYKANAGNAAPGVDQATSVGFATEGDGTPDSETIPGPYWFHMLSTEIENVILRGGQVPDAATLTQLRAAIVSIATEIAAAAVAGVVIPDVPAATEAVAGIVERANQGEGRGGTDTTRYLSAFRMLDALRNGSAFRAMTSRYGATRHATPGETEAGASTGLSVTPAGLHAAAAAGVLGGDVVLASGFALAAGVRQERALSESLNGFRWIGLLYGDGSDYLRVARSRITPRVPSTVSELLMWERGQLYEVNPLTGELASRGAMQDLPGNPQGAGMTEHAGALLGMSVSGGRANLFGVNPMTGVLTARGGAQRIRVSDAHCGLTSSGGVLFAQTGGTEVELYVVDPANGMLTSRGRHGIPVGGQPGGFTDFNGTLYSWIIQAPAAALLYSVDPADGTLTARGVAQSLGAQSGWQSAGLTQLDGDLVGIVGNLNTDVIQLYTVDPADGTLTARGAEQDIGFHPDDLALAARLIARDMGFITIDGIEIDRAGASSLGLRAETNLDVHQVLGIR